MRWMIFKAYDCNAAFAATRFCSFKITKQFSSRQQISGQDAIGQRSITQTYFVRGMRTENTVPSSSVEVTSMVPPCASVISRAMKRPKPKLVDGLPSYCSLSESWINGLKIDWSELAGIGGPELVTLTMTAPFSAAKPFTDTPPVTPANRDVGAQVVQHQERAEAVGVRGALFRQSCRPRCLTARLHPQSKARAAPTTHVTRAVAQYMQMCNCEVSLAPSRAAAEYL